MSDSTEMSARMPSRPALMLIIIVMAALGAIMLLHGLGILSAAWLTPNPRTPSWIFAMLGIILVLAAWLSLGKLRPNPQAGHRAAGYAVLGLSIVGMHWLVFFAEGASCSAKGTLTMTAQLPSACGLVMGAAVLLLDLIMLIVGLATLRSYRRG